MASLNHTLLQDFQIKKIKKQTNEGIQQIQPVIQDREKIAIQEKQRLMDLISSKKQVAKVQSKIVPEIQIQKQIKKQIKVQLQHEEKIEEPKQNKLKTPLLSEKIQNKNAYSQAASIKELEYYTQLLNNNTKLDTDIKIKRKNDHQLKQQIVVNDEQKKVINNIDDNQKIHTQKVNEQQEKNIKIKRDENLNQVNTKQNQSSQIQRPKSQNKQTTPSNSHKDQTVLSNSHKDQVVPNKSLKDQIVPNKSYKDKTVNSNSQKEIMVPNKSHKDKTVLSNSHKEIIVPTNSHKEQKSQKILQKLPIDQNKIKKQEKPKTIDPQAFEEQLKFMQLLNPDNKKQKKEPPVKAAPDAAKKFTLFNPNAKTIQPTKVPINKVNLRPQDDEYDLDDSFIDNGNGDIQDSGEQRDYLETFGRIRQRLKHKENEDEDIPEDSFEEMQRQDKQSRLIGHTIDQRELKYIQREVEKERRK